MIKLYQVWISLWLFYREFLYAESFLWFCILIQNLYQVYANYNSVNNNYNKYTIVHIYDIVYKYIHDFMIIVYIYYTYINVCNYKFCTNFYDWRFFATKNIHRYFIAFFANMLERLLRVLIVDLQTLHHFLSTACGLHTWLGTVHIESENKHARNSPTKH